MNANRLAKENEVKAIANKIKEAKALVLVEYAGLTVGELQILRKQLVEADIELKVFKNRLVKLALKDFPFHDLNQALVGPNALAFGYGDDISPAKILAQFASKHEALKLKAGTYEGKVVDATELAQIALLPTLPEALTMLATSLLAPVSQIGKGLHLLVEENKLSA